LATSLKKRTKTNVETTGPETSKGKSKTVEKAAHYPPSQGGFVVS